MANKIKKISINAFGKAVNSQYEPIHTIEWNGISIVVKHSLTLRDMLEFVNSVVKSCFGEDGSYMPEVRDFATRNCIIKYYTNISLPSNVEQRYDLLFHSTILDEIIPNIDYSQFDKMMRAIKEKTAHLAQANIEAVTKQMNELCASFENMQKQFSDTFSGVDKDALTGVINALGDGVIDEEKIVQAVINAESKNGE